ncbi:hypothetical protein [Streptomyces chryseus]|uniref:hypothetical protein n=1 Tax=Streptomyces chryseus TaxID=68186 RepID=UPI00110F8985|nr:hypothetical protein [Streptomyces chryseus]GGX18071.1 hypothetical protein GCM10010353_36530 [Streptomyces chryseus]
MTVLGLEGCGLLVATPLLGVVPEARTLVVLPVLLLAVLCVGALATVVYVLPSVALGHWLGKRRDGERRWWWLVPAAGVVLVPVVGLPLLLMSFYGSAPVLDARQDMLDWSLYAAVLYGVSLPAALAAHTAVLRADAGRPSASVRRILAYGSLVLVIEWVVVLDADRCQPTG